jgi:DNA-binding CsgD family transcriptional regulator
VRTMESRVAALVADFSPAVDELETVVVRHLSAYFGCDAAYLATIGPTFLDHSPPYFQQILTDPHRYDPGQRKAQEIVARFGPAFIDTEAYTPAERDRLPTFRELLRPAGISSVILATVNIGERTTGMLHIVRSGSPFRAEALADAKPLLRTIAILHQAAVGLPDAGSQSAGEAAERLARLTEREHQVALLAAEGFGAVQIAAQLGTAVNTVRRQLEASYRKCGIGNRVELATLIQRTRQMVGVLGRGSPTVHTNLVRILGSVRMHPAVRHSANAL